MKVVSSFNLKQVHYHKDFVKSYKKLTRSIPNLKDKIAQRVDLFLLDRFNPILRDHALSGEMYGLRSFSITGDIRIIYKETEIFFLFLDIGTHNQVY